jgi:hypothetical protein
MNVYIKVINLKWYYMFRRLLGHHQVSVNIKALNLHRILIHIMGFCILYNIALATRYSGFTEFFWTFSIVLYSKKTQRFGNWICFRPQMKVGGKTPTQSGPLERANLS